MTDSGYILIVDDEKGIRFGLRNLFSRNGYTVFEADSIDTAVAIARKEEIDVALLDIQLESGEEGLDLLRRLKNVNEDIQIIMITGFGSIDTAVASMKYGACDYILKPIDNDKILNEVKKAIEYSKLKAENSYLRNEQSRDYHRHPIVTLNNDMRMILNMADQIKNAAANVLILGESGSGKEVLARYVHFTGNRRKGNFVSLNSAAISESLLLSELFGHVRGAFTGAVSQKAGMFEIADGGTLFLDEIGDMPMDIQAKLLRVIEDRSFQRVGGVKKIHVDFQLIAATNKDLKKLISEGKFREDLYYRLNVISFPIPPLRERREDIVPLAEHFIGQYGSKYGKNINGLSSSASAALNVYDWPGNVRELQNVINRAVLLCRGRELSLEELEPSIEKPGGGEPEAVPAGDRFRQLGLPSAGSLKSRMAGVIAACEKEIIKSCLEEYGGNKTRAAEALDVTRKTLAKKAVQYGL